MEHKESLMTSHHTDDTDLKADNPRPLSIDFPSINSEYKNASHKSLAPKAEAAVALPRPNPSFWSPNRLAVKSVPSEHPKQQNHCARFVGAPIVSVVNRRLLTVCFTGYNFHAACKMFRIFSPKYNLVPWKAIIGIDDLISSFVPKFRLRIRILNEQVRFNNITLTYALDGDSSGASILFFHFDLSNAHDCQESYDISMGRIKLCHDHSKWRKKKFCMIGITDDNKTSNEAMEIFNKFKNDSGIKDVLVFNLDSQGEENLREFMLNVFSTLDLTPSLEESSKVTPMLGRI